MNTSSPQPKNPVGPIGRQAWRPQSDEAPPSDKAKAWTAAMCWTAAVVPGITRWWEAYECLSPVLGWRSISRGSRAELFNMGRCRCWVIIQSNISWSFIPHHLTLVPQPSSGRLHSPPTLAPHPTPPHNNPSRKLGYQYFRNRVA